MTIPPIQPCCMTRDDRHRCFTGRAFRATDCRNAAGQAPDDAELEAARRLGRHRTDFPR